MIGDDRSIFNESIADQVINAADAYLLGSNVKPTGNIMRARSRFLIRAWFTKTAAGVATPIINIRVGAAAGIADAVQLQFTGAAQTAAADNGYIEVNGILRNVGALAILSGVCKIVHNLESTGVGVLSTQILTAIANPGFDSTAHGQSVGMSINPGAAGVWTVQGVIAEFLDT